MARLIEQSSNGFLNEGATISKKEMARLEGESSNDFFEILEDWNEQLKHIDFDIEEPRP
jgi:hypothetical protein